MEADDDVEDDDMDFNPFLREGSPSETSSSLTSEAECEETSFDNKPNSEVYLDCSVGNEKTAGCALAQNRLQSKGASKENGSENTSTQVYCENSEHVNGLGKESLPSEAGCSPTVQNSHHLSLEGGEEDAICRRTRAKYSLENHSLEELETFLQESDDEGDLHNVDEEEEYRKFLAAVLSGVGNDTQVCQGDENQDEDENDADFELEIEEALESDGDENAENYEITNGRNEKDGHRPQIRQKKQYNKLSRAGNYHHELTKSTLRPILPYVSHAPLAPGQAYGYQYPSQNALVPSLIPVNSAAFMNGFTDQQLGQLYVLIYEHVQLLIQTFSLSVLDPCKQNVAIDVKKLIVELVGCRDQALARRNTHQQFCFESRHLCSSYSFASSDSLEHQWVPLIKSPVMSILDVSPLHLALGYLSDVATAVVKYRKSHVDGTADKNGFKKEPLFPSMVLSTCKDASNVSKGRLKNLSTASPTSSGQLQHRKSLAATLVDSSKKGTVALVPFDIARLAQRFFPLFNSSLFPHKPPSAAMANRVLFTDAEDGLLALGLLEYNNDWGAIQKRFLPCKSKHQIFVRQKNRSSSKASDNPIKDMRRRKASPLTVEEIQRIQEGLKIFKNDWTSVWRFVVPYRDPSLLQRQWRVATGIQRSYSKSEASKEKRRSYEAKRRKLRASMSDAQVDDNVSEGVENDDDSYVNEAFLADTENRSMDVMPCQLSLSSNAGKSIMMQSGTSLNDRCGVASDCVEQKGNGTKPDLTTSYTPFSYCTSDGVSGVSLDQLQASQLCKEKGSHVVKLAPDLPPVNLPPSVRVISQVAFHQNAANSNGSSDNATKDLFHVPPPAFTESVYKQLNLFPDHSTSARSQQNGMSSYNTTEDGSEQDFQMHPLLFQYPQELPYSHPVQNLGNHSRKHDLFPFERVQVEKRSKHATDSTENGTHANANTIDFHPLLQRTEVNMYNEVPEADYQQSVYRSECNMNEPPVDDQPTARQASTSPCERESNIDLDIHLCSSMDARNAKEFRGTFSKSVIQPEGAAKDRPSISGSEAGNDSSHHCIEEPNEESMQGIVMEQEELSDSEEDSQHVEFECEEMDDSEQEDVQSVELSLTQNKGTLTSVVSGELQEDRENNDQRQIQQGLLRADKQGASSTQKSQGSSNARLARARLKPEHAKRTGSRTNQHLSSSRTMEPSRSKTRRSKMRQGQAGTERTPNDSRRTRKNPASS